MAYVSTTMKRGTVTDLCAECTSAGAIRSAVRPGVQGIVAGAAPGGADFAEVVAQQVDNLRIEESPRVGSREAKMAGRGRGKGGLGTMRFSEKSLVLSASSVRSASSSSRLRPRRTVPLIGLLSTRPSVCTVRNLGTVRLKTTAVSAADG